MLEGAAAKFVEGSQMRRIVAVLVALAALVLGGGAGGQGF